MRKTIQRETVKPQNEKVYKETKEPSDDTERKKCFEMSMY